MNMKSKKVMKKTYVLMLSQSFPTKHPRSGNPTGFRKKFLSGEKRHHPGQLPALGKTHTRGAAR